MTRQVILMRGLKNPRYAPDFLPKDAIGLDFRNRCVWYNGSRYPSYRAYHRGRVSFRILTALLVRSPHMVPKQELLEYVFGDDESGGPDAADRVLNVYAYNLCHDVARRTNIASHIGFKIITHWGRGYSLEFIPEHCMEKAA